MLILAAVDEGGELIGDEEMMQLSYYSPEFGPLSDAMDAEDWEKVDMLALWAYGSPFPGVKVEVFLAGPPCDEDGVLFDS